jgi:hypothetical protein
MLLKKIMTVHRCIQNVEIYSLGRMSKFWMLNLVAHNITTGLWIVSHLCICLYFSWNRQVIYFIECNFKYSWKFSVANDIFNSLVKICHYCVISFKYIHLWNFTVQMKECICVCQSAVWMTKRDISWTAQTTTDMALFHSRYFWSKLFNIILFKFRDYVAVGCE